MVSSQTQEEKADNAQEYASFNSKIQIDLKKMMKKHKKQLEEFGTDQER